MPRARSTEANMRIGLAGWSEAASRYGKFLPTSANGSSALQRYASAFDFVEINSSFYRQVRSETYGKWAGEVPEDFRFSVKMHRLITHYARLKNTDLLENFFDSAEALGEKLAVVLVQLPPTLVFDKETAGKFFRALRRRYKGCAVCEPRHVSWSRTDARELFDRHRIGPVLTVISSLEDDSWDAFDKCLPLYMRLHGTPRKYYSSYSETELKRLAGLLASHTGRRRYVVFDNTAGPAGVRNALELQRLLV